MPQLEELHEVEELSAVVENSKEKPVFIFKRSMTCPISAEAFSQFQTFTEQTNAEIAPYVVKVRETREVSNKIAEMTHIEHQSPQVLMMIDEEVLWHTSHSDITVDSLEDALKQYGSM